MAKPSIGAPGSGTLPTTNSDAYTTQCLRGRLHSQTRRAARAEGDADNLDLASGRTSGRPSPATAVTTGRESPVFWERG